MSEDAVFDPKKAKREMRAQGRKTQWLADQCERTRNYMSLVLNGKRTPSRATWKLMAIALGVNENAFAKAPPKVKAAS